MHVQMALQPCGTGMQDDPCRKAIPSEGGVSIGHRDYSSTSPTVSVTAAGDFRTHEVREIDIAPGARGGRYPTLCGQMITTASMVEPAHRWCPRCVELRDGEEAPRSTGLLRRLTGR